MNARHTPPTPRARTRRSRVAVRRTSLLLSVTVMPVGWGLVPLAHAVAAPSCDGRTATIVGTDRAEELVGTDGPDVIVALGGADEIEAGGGDDVVCGGDGDDVVRGGAGVDVLSGGADHDRLSTGSGAGGSLVGDAGDDRLFAQAADTTLSGMEDDDELRGFKPGLVFSGGPGEDTIIGSDFPDVILGGPDGDDINAADGDDVEVDGGDGDDRLAGGDGNDRLLGGEGTDVCDGGAGRDVCDGGSPGTAANTPTDPDECSAEERISCRGDEGGYPDRFLLHVEGTFRDVDEHSYENGEWTLDIVLRRGATGQNWYVHESMQGSWRGEGAGRNCSWAGAGGFKESPWNADLQLFPNEKEYFLDFGVGIEGVMPGVCDGHAMERHAFWDTWEDTGNAEPLPWDPSNLQITGTETKDTGLGTTTHEWTITPLE